MRRLLLLFSIVALLFLVGCAMLESANMAKMIDLERKMSSAVDFVTTVKEKIAETIEKGQKGELTAKEVANLLTVLYEQKTEGEQHLNAIRGQIKDLQESGVPWWQIAIGVVLAGLNIATGKGLINAKSTTGQAINGLSSLVRTIENVYVKRGTVKDVKLKIAKLGDPLIESVVSKLPPSPVVEIPPAEEPLPKNKT